MLRSITNGRGRLRLRPSWIRVASLHANFDSGNLRRFKTNKVGKAGRDLPELCRHRAVVGVDNEFPRFEIRHPGAARQIRGQVGDQDGLQPY